MNKQNCILTLENGRKLGYAEYGVSGGPRTIACAYQLPERVLAGATIRSNPPMSRPGAYQGLPVSNQILARSARHFPVIVRLIRSVMRRMILGVFEKASRQLMSSIPDADQAILYNSQTVEYFIRAVREGFRSGSKGVAQDDIVINREWGFNLEAIKPRIDIWQGELDGNVPVGAAKYLCNKLPHTRTFFLANAGHFFILKCWEKILSVLLFDQEGDEQHE